MSFNDKLAAAWASSGSMLCVGLDPDPMRMPAPLDGLPDAIERFCFAIVDATADLVCAFKPQFAHFASQRAEPTLERVCRYIRERYPDVVLVLDAKRGDIGSTAEHYAKEAFGRYGADAVTVNPYLGTDAAGGQERRRGVGPEVRVDGDRVRAVAPERLLRVVLGGRADVPALGVEHQHDVGVALTDVAADPFERRLGALRGEVGELRLERAHQVGRGVDDRDAEALDRIG